MVCSKCNKKLDKNEKFCIYCGTRLVPGVECACRAILKEDITEETATKFCIYCGAMLSGGEICACREEKKAVCDTVAEVIAMEKEGLKG